MRKIESFQMKKIYAIGHALGIKGWRICRAVPLLRNHPAESRRNIHRDQEA